MMTLTQGAFETSTSRFCLAIFSFQCDKFGVLVDTGATNSLTLLIHILGVLKDLKNMSHSYVLK